MQQQQQAPEQRQQAIDALCKRHELRPQIVEDLVRVISPVRVVMIVDDSSSMQQEEIPEGTANPFAARAVKITRWSEAVQNTAMVCEYVFAICHEPVDVYFLNRPKVVGAKCNADLAAAFSHPPEGHTPLTAAYMQVLRDYAWTQQRNQQLLILIFSDGEATTVDGRQNDSENFRRALLSKGKNVHTVIVECTDDEASMDYIDKWKGQIPQFDGIDHFTTEVAKVRALQGSSFNFSRSDYIALILLGAFLRSYFYVDQRRFGAQSMADVSALGRSRTGQYSGKMTSGGGSVSVLPVSTQPFVPQAAPVYVPVAPAAASVAGATAAAPGGSTLTQSEQEQADQQRAEAIAALCRRHELRPQVAEDLVRVLTPIRVVLIVDDSGSMAAMERPENLAQAGANMRVTRWSEAVQNSAMICEFVFTICHQPVDTYFLNRAKVVGAKSNADLAAAFNAPPAGGTPLTPVFNQVMRDYAWTTARGQQLLVIILTDGEPSGSGGIDGFRRALLAKPPNVHVCVVECTDNEETMDYIDGWKGSIPQFDGIDHFGTELQKVRRAQGQNFPFGRSDYIALILLGTFMRSYFYVDQLTFNNCCTIL